MSESIVDSMGKHARKAELSPRLREATLRDVWALHRWRSSKDVLKYFENQQATSFISHFHWFHRYLYRNKSGYMFFFQCGFKRCGMTRLDLRVNSSEAEISILVSPKFRSLGIGGKLVDLTIKFAVENLEVTRIIARINRANAPSLKMFGKYGFIKYSADAIYDYLELRVSQEFTDF